PGRLRFALAHHGTDRRLSRFTARLQSAKDRAPIRVRPILAQLELAFEPLDLDLESRNSSNHPLEIVLREPGQRPGTLSFPFVQGHGPVQDRPYRQRVVYRARAAICM